MRTRSCVLLYLVVLAGPTSYDLRSKYARARSICTPNEFDKMGDCLTDGAGYLSKVPSVKFFLTPISPVDQKMVFRVRSNKMLFDTFFGAPPPRCGERLYQYPQSDRGLRCGALFEFSSPGPDRIFAPKPDGTAGTGVWLSLKKHVKSSWDCDL